MRRANLLEKTLMLGTIKGKRRRRQRVRWLDSITDSKDMSLRKLPGDRGRQRSRVCRRPSSHKELDPTERLSSNTLTPEPGT